MKISSVGFSVLAAVAVFAAAPSQAGLMDALKGKTETTDGNAPNKLGDYKGIKKEIAVKGFENQAGWSGDYDLGNNLSLMLESALFDTGRFVLLQREKLKDTIEEQDLQASGRAAKAKSIAQTGKLRSARFIAGGAVTEVSREQSGSDGGINFKGFSIGGKKDTAQIATIVTLTDTTTGEIIAKQRVVGKAGGTGLRVGYSGAIGGQLGGFAKTPIGEAAQDVINQAAAFIAKKMEEQPLGGSVVKVTDGGQIIINRGSEFGIEVGQALTMAKEGKELIDPDSGASLGKEPGKVLGHLKVSKVSEKVSFCDVVDGEKSPEPGSTVTFDTK